MYKVVIVDDEPVIVEGLRRMVDWKSFDCEVAGTAYSGSSGMELIQKTDPDILFSDIRMANIDGLTMIAGLKSEHADMEIAILTGYRDFEYARKAIQLGVRRYLLKPSKMDEINEAITAMTAALKEHPREKKQEPAAAKSFLVNNALKYMEGHYMEHIHLADVAEQVYISPCYLSKLLNSELHETFSDLLNRIRMEHARELMKDPSLLLTDISRQVGIEDLAQFSRVFRKSEGMSPSEYRNSL